MINKIVPDLQAAIHGIQDGSILIVSGFGDAGIPFELLHALRDNNVRELTIVANNAGSGHVGIEALLEAGCVRKLIASYPRSIGGVAINELYRAGKIELELVPQGTIIERMRCGGAGLGGFYTPTGVGTPLAEGKEVKTIDGKDYLLEKPIRGDVALIKATVGDRWGNLIYRKSARNFAPVMATAAKLVVAQVYEIAELGALDPECVVTPGIYVDRVVQVGRPS